VAASFAEKDKPTGEGPMTGAAPTELSAVLSDLLAQARVAVRHDPTTADRWLDQLEWILERSKSAPDLAKPRPGGLAPWQVARTKRYIEANPTERLSTHGLAVLVRLSDKQFARAFRISVGCPPHAYVLQRRILRAKTLIVETDLPLAQIALEAGLADQAHLSRLFRRFFGATPSAYRRLMCAPAEPSDRIVA